LPWVCEYEEQLEILGVNRYKGRPVFWPKALLIPAQGQSLHAIRHAPVSAPQSACLSSTVFKPLSSFGSSFSKGFTAR
jgi:hypothetical protein